MVSTAEDERARRRTAARRERQAVAARRRRLALAGVALAAAVAGALVGSRDDGEQTATTAAAACPEEVVSQPKRLVGQMLVVRMEDEATPALLRAARRGEIGGVVLFPSAGARPARLGAEVQRLRAAAADGGAPAPVVTIDQEGGSVKRLAGLPPDRAPGELADASAARAQGEKTGRALGGIGVTVDLAPVLDVPRGPEAFIAARAFAGDPGAVAERGVAFAQGLQESGVAATAKHFPGLGTATLNTDEQVSLIAAPASDLAVDLEPFRAAIEAQIALVMVANATYAAYDPSRPASLSAEVIDGLLRAELGFDGVVISDDLGAGALRGAGIDEGEAAVAAARAGTDLLLFALSDGAAARSALLEALRSGRLDRASLLESCARSTALRADFAG